MKIEHLLVAIPARVSLRRLRVRRRRWERHQKYSGSESSQIDGDGLGGRQSSAGFPEAAQLKALRTQVLDTDERPLSHCLAKIDAVHGNGDDPSEGAQPWQRKTELILSLV